MRQRTPRHKKSHGRIHDFWDPGCDNARRETENHMAKSMIIRSAGCCLAAAGCVPGCGNARLMRPCGHGIEAAPLGFLNGHSCDGRCDINPIWQVTNFEPLSTCLCPVFDFWKQKCRKLSEPLNRWQWYHRHRFTGRYKGSKGCFFGRQNFEN